MEIRFWLKARRYKSVLLLQVENRRQTEHLEQHLTHRRLHHAVQCPCPPARPVMRLLGNGARVLRRLLSEVREKNEPQDSEARRRLQSAENRWKLQHSRRHLHHEEETQVLRRPQRDVGEGPDDEARRQDEESTTPVKEGVRLPHAPLRPLQSYQ